MKKTVPQPGQFELFGDPTAGAAIVPIDDTVPAKPKRVGKARPAGEPPAPALSPKTAEGPARRAVREDADDAPDSRPTPMPYDAAEPVDDGELVDSDAEAEWAAELQAAPENPSFDTDTDSSVSRDADADAEPEAEAEAEAEARRRSRRRSRPHDVCT